MTNTQLTYRALTELINNKSHNDFRNTAREKRALLDIEWDLHAQRMYTLAYKLDAEEWNLGPVWGRRRGWCGMNQIGLELAGISANQGRIFWESHEAWLRILQREDSYYECQL